MQLCLSGLHARWAPRATLFRSLFLSLGILPLIATIAQAQRPPVVTSVRHANKTKEINSLDWVAQYDQLAQYAAWWKETAACARIPLPASRPDSVQFYFVNAVDFLPTPTDKPDRMVSGVSYAASEQIYLSVLRLRNEPAVKHEMLHQLLYWWGEPDWHEDARSEFKSCKLDHVSEPFTSAHALR